MQTLLHCLDLLRPEGIAVLPIAAWAAGTRLWWRRGKTALDL